MAETLDGLFGPTPQQIQQAQQQQLAQNAAQFAKMSPFEKAGMLTYQGGGGLVNSLAPMTGGVNIAQQQAAKQQQIMGAEGVNMNTSEGVAAAAEKFRQAGDLNTAMKLAALSRKLKDEESARALQTAHADYYKSGGASAGRTKEYQDQVDIYLDPDSTPEEKAMAKARIDALNAKGQGGSRAGTPQFKTGDDGLVYMMNKETGETKVVTKPDGTPLKAADASPELKARMHQASAGAGEVGKASGIAQGKLPSAEIAASTAIEHVDKLLNHKAFKSAVGMGLPYAAKMVGTPERDFANMLAQTKGEAFLQAYTLLKGGGSIANAEGEKAQASINRMDAATSEQEFRDAAEDYKTHIKRGMEALKKTASLSYEVPAAPMPQGYAPQTPVAPMPQGYAPQAPVAPMPQGTIPSVSFTTPAEVKAAVGRTIDRQTARKLLLDMKARGIEIK